MPPKPDDYDDSDDYMKACMTDPDMVEEYPDEEKRQEVCYAVWQGDGKMRKLKKGVRYQKGTVDIDVTVGGKEGNGWVEGYASTFGNVDSYNEVVEKGAYAKTIQEQVPGLPLMVTHLAHGGDANDIIGEVTEAKEDDTGLWVHAELDDGEIAQKTREQINDGKVQKMSVGYEMIHWEVDRRDTKDIVRLKELRLMDASVTMNPVNQEAVITAAKEAVATVENRQSHLGDDELKRLCETFEAAAKELRLMIEPDDTDNESAIVHSDIENRRRRLELLKLQE